MDSTATSIPIPNLEPHSPEYLQHWTNIIQGPHPAETLANLFTDMQRREQLMQSALDGEKKKVEEWKEKERSGRVEMIDVFMDEDERLARGRRARQRLQERVDSLEREVLGTRQQLVASSQSLDQVKADLAQAQAWNVQSGHQPLEGDAFVQERSILLSAISQQTQTITGLRTGLAGMQETLERYKQSMEAEHERDCARQEADLAAHMKRLRREFLGLDRYEDPNLVTLDQIYDPETRTFAPPEARRFAQRA